LEAIDVDPEVAEAMMNRLNRAMEDFAAIADYLEE
jgi:hypothetical protein